jgi:hypothetical protein
VTGFSFSPARLERIARMDESIRVGPISDAMTDVLLVLRRPILEAGKDAEMARIIQYITSLESVVRNHNLHREVRAEYERLDAK